MSKATEKNLKIVKTEEEPAVDAVEVAVEEEAKAPAEAVAQAPEKKGMSTGKKLTIGGLILTAVAGLAWGLTKIFGGGDDTDVIDTTGSVE